MSAVTRNLKEAGGKIPSQRTEITYKAVASGRVCPTKQSLILPELAGVNVVATWEEGCCSYPGRSGRYAQTGNSKKVPMSKQHRKVLLNCQKSVPFIVLMTLVKAREREGKDGYVCLCTKHSKHEDSSCSKEVIHLKVDWKSRIKSGNA